MQHVHGMYSCQEAPIPVIYDKGGKEGQSLFLLMVGSSLFPFTTLPAHSGSNTTSAEQPPGTLDLEIKKDIYVCEKGLL